MTIHTLHTPPAWSNGALRLYHGTIESHANSIMNNGVDISKGNPLTDFGTAFYTTTIKKQAETWAWNHSQLKSEKPFVVCFDLDRDLMASLESLSFVCCERDIDDFWGFVFHCRNGGVDHNRNLSPKGVYDLVIGPVSAFWRQKLALYGCDQLSFHSKDAEDVINKSPRSKYEVVP
ncbi:MAG: DUF3990 domain-containing protein [Desulfobacteraceae bacterium]|nr:MAG: DUF3990 domain-containing protein [Desulfobacteraceae bacterium]